jgi:hypothetical protein
MGSVNPLPSLPSQLKCAISRGMSAACGVEWAVFAVVVVAPVAVMVGCVPERIIVYPEQFPPAGEPELADLPDRDPEACPDTEIITGEAPAFVDEQGRATCRAIAISARKYAAALRNDDAVQWYGAQLPRMEAGRTADREHAQATVDWLSARYALSEQDARILRGVVVGLVVVAEALFVGGVYIGTQIAGGAP